MFRRVTFALIAASGTIALSSNIAHADWRDEMPTFRVGLLGGENEADRLRNNECFRVAMEERLGVPVEMFPAPDYAGVIQGLVAGQLDYASLGASGYAAIYLQDPEAVEPIFVSAEADGSLGYIAAMYVRSDSDIHSLEGMEGYSLAYADPNSTSGYLIPRAELRAAGINDAEFFSRTGFGGGHEQAVIAVLEGQYDAGVTWVSGQGNPADGYTRGNLRRMIDNGLLDMADLRVIWESNLIPNGPVVVRKSMPDEAREIIVDYLANQLETDPQCYYDISFGEGQGWQPVDHSFFEGIVAMRRAELEGSR
ncbi:phosphonate ABC transporter substrate-binding protein [Saliniramus fredricksonii]|uniref:Phosphonate transport system substrate-binding protein n=1 Tax=Saliniramus fredricksonii TaxID=1653334 RepID=A0ABY0KD03_9HYPH|nr:phosphonate ABC transporter substrate-binding protein [Saliniramus fredricksonii]SCC82344.1 phosphonate transport system substrate-binding protein [Saliniramus fredricksonii]